MTLSGQEIKIEKSVLRDKVRDFVVQLCVLKTNIRGCNFEQAKSSLSLFPILSNHILSSLNKLSPNKD